jgi:response regulator RpfG family c-di-GMP phosphodiesterase
MAEVTRLGERLVQAGLVTTSAVSQALELQKRAGGRLGDCLVELRLISEQALLRFLAAELNTRYVSAEKLAKVRVEPDVLDRVPVRMAEKVGLLPIAYDAQKRILSVVMAEPQNTETLEELKVVARADQIVHFIALLSSVTAGIKKFYYGDPSAFALIEASAAQQKKDLGGMGEAFEQSRPGTRQVQTQELPASGTYSGPGPNPSSIARMAQDGRSISQVSTPGGAPTSVRRAMDAIRRASVMSDNDYIETLNVLVGLLELQGAQRGHSARIAKQSRAVGQRLGLSHRELSYLTIAAYLHELGKGTPHTTVLSAATSEPHKAAARRDLRTPVKLFESVHLPSQVSTILMQSYEAFDGSGLPQGVKGQDIAMGARILAAVDSYEDLLANPDNLAGGLLPKGDALRLLTAQSGKLFDPMVLEVLRQVGTGEILRQRIIAEGHQVLLAEPDEASRVVLTRALSRAGLSVTAVSNSELALHHATVGDADLVIAAISLQPDDAFVLTAELRSEPLTAGMPVLLLADTDEPSVRDRAAQLGVAGILLKPIDEEQLAQTAKKLLEERLASGAPHRPVLGSIEELALPDLLRILAGSQRSGQVVVSADEGKGELYLEQGRLVHAVCGPLKGREALRKVVGFRAGDFRIDPNNLIHEQQIDLDVEVALREAVARPSSSAAAGT